MNEDDIYAKRVPLNYDDNRKPMKNKKKFYITNKLYEYPRNSNYSNSSKYTSF